MLACLAAPFCAVLAWRRTHAPFSQSEAVTVRRVAVTRRSAAPLLLTSSCQAGAVRHCRTTSASLPPVAFHAERLALVVPAVAAVRTLALEPPGVRAVPAVTAAGYQRTAAEARREGCQRPHADSGRAICKADQEQPGRCHAPAVSAHPEGGAAFCILLIRIPHCPRTPLPA